MLTNRFISSKIHKESLSIYMSDKRTVDEDLTFQTAREKEMEIIKQLVFLSSVFRSRIVK